MTKRTAKPKAPTPPDYPKVYETFNEPWIPGLNIQRDPSCFNGRVMVRKYRVTIELIEEPREVIAARLQDLWERCTNSHQRNPLRCAAAEIGLELLDEDYGKRADR